MVVLPVFPWVVFAVGLFLARKNVPGTPIDHYGDTLYRGIAVFSTAGIADTPASSATKLVGGIWIIIGSILFPGAIVATVTTHFMRPMRHSHKRITDSIEYYLEQRDDLSLQKRDLLKNSVDSRFEHVEERKKLQLNQDKSSPGEMEA